MAQLKLTKVRRRGVTAPNYRLESTNCSAIINKETGSLDIKFKIASRGGGFTCVWVEIGDTDVRSINLEQADSCPESVSTFVECTSIAIERNLEKLDRIRDPIVLEKMASVEAFVDKKYRIAPAGEDDDEREVLDDVLFVNQELDSIRKR